MSNFRDFRSSISHSPSMQQAFREHGIADEGTALAKGHRSRRTSVVVLPDGTIEKADSRIYRDVLIREREIRNAVSAAAARAA